MPAVGLPSLIVAIAITVIIAAMTVAPAPAQNLDQDKSGAKLFAATCADCHKSARGLAKGRMSFTLSYYLRQHYTSSTSSAAALTAYLQSVDTPRTKAKQVVAARKSTTTVGASTQPLRSSPASASVPRPPASIPAR
jgi:mono/diheme cytochrome c family protein